MKNLIFQNLMGQGKASHKLISLVKIKKIRFVLLTIRVEWESGSFLLLKQLALEGHVFQLEVLGNPLEALVYYKGSKLESYFRFIQHF